MELLPVPLSSEALKLLPQLFETYVCERRAGDLRLLLIQHGIAGIATHVFSVTLLVVPLFLWRRGSLWTTERCRRTAASKACNPER